MPPSLPRDSDDNLAKIQDPYYTNEDVTILHDIVVHAQELLPTLPERERVPTNALFHAYYAILPTIGIDADHDNRYARVLFKIGGMRGDGSLYQKFEGVLSRMGIEIQFDQEEKHEGQESKRESHQGKESDPLPGLDTTHELENREHERRRRNSEGSFSDRGPGYHDEQVERPRSRSFISDPYPVPGTEQLISTSTVPQTATQTIDQTGHFSKSHNDNSEEGKESNIGTWLNDNVNVYLPRKRTRSTSTHASVRIRRRSLPTTQRDLTTSPEPPSPTETFPISGQSSQMLQVGKGSDVHEKLLLDTRTIEPMSESSTDIKVNLVQQFHLKNLARQTWFQWHQKVLQLQDDNQNLELLARHRDKQILLRQAFDSWRSAIVKRRQMVETEYFFAHLERRAGRARDVFLLTKAFTHWAYCTSDEVQRISLARRHILRTRYFAAWRDITVVNLLKIRRQVLRKFFFTWRKKNIGMVANTERSVSIFASNLVQKTFWAWFWTFCEHKAPIWWGDRVQRKLLAVWIRLSEKTKEDEKLAFDFYNGRTVQKTFLSWKAKIKHLGTQTYQADRFRIDSLCHPAVLEWRVELGLLPPLQTLQKRKRLQSERNLFELWNLRARQEHHAAAVDRSKILREAWVTWNDKVRCKALQSRIHDRIMLQGLYKWVLAERLVLARRLLERGLLQTSLQKLRYIMQLSIEKDGRYCRSAQDLGDRRLKSDIVKRWRLSMANQMQRQYLASDFSSPAILHHALVKWINCSRRTEQLQIWARNGEFYFVASKSLKTWKNAMESVKREKRRVAYGKFRRRTKMSLAVRVLSEWRHRAKVLTAAEQTAAEIHYNKNVVFCIEAFDQWRGRTEEITEMELMGDHSLFRKCFNEMKLRLINHRQSLSEAMAFFEEHTMSLCIKRWSRIALQIRAREHLVSELREKYIKKMLRKMIAHWRQRTPPEQPLMVSGSAPLYAAGDHGRSISGLTEKKESWPELDEPDTDDWTGGIDEAVTSISVPGYLTTPSKRMARAKTVSKLPSTTPRAPLSTPAERNLRAQYSGGSLPSFRRTMVKSLLGRKVASTRLDEDRSAAGTGGDTAL